MAVVLDRWRRYKGDVHLESIVQDEVFLTHLAAAVAAPRDSREFAEARFSVIGLVASLPEWSNQPRAIVTIHGWHSFEPEFAVDRMLEVAREQRDVPTGLTWLRKVSRASGVRGGVVRALYGVNCESAIELSPGLVLMPWRDVPRSSHRDFVLGRYPVADADKDRQPTAALHRLGFIAPFFINPDREGELRTQPREWFDEILDATRLLTLVRGCVPRDAGHWLRYDDPDFEFLGEQGITSYGADMEPLLGLKPEPVSLESLQGLFPAFQAMAKEDQRRIRLALERIDRARCQMWPGNAAIDLAIALEVLFVNVDSGEHSYKISLRATKFLGGVREEQLSTFTRLRRLYDVRSSMVHTGEAAGDFKVRGTRLAVTDLISSADEICTQSIRRMLGLGGIPKDWSDIEI